MSEPCLSIPRLAKQYGVGRTTVWKAVTSGEIPAHRIGSTYRVRVSSIPETVIQRWANPPQRRWADLPTGEVVYFLASVPGYVKIGFTANLAERMKDLQVGAPVPLRLLAHVQGCSGLEREYHCRFAAHRCEGEWFTLAPEIEAEIEKLSASTGSIG